MAMPCHCLIVPSSSPPSSPRIGDNVSDAGVLEGGVLANDEEAERMEEELDRRQEDQRVRKREEKKMACFLKTVVEEDVRGRRVRRGGNGLVEVPRGYSFFLFLYLHFVLKGFRWVTNESA